MEQIYCQSCGMPLSKPEERGTEKDGAQSADYCVYCYRDGAFTQELTMDEMIALNAQYVEQWDMDITEDEAIAMMKEHFPALKRWK